MADGHEDSNLLLQSVSLGSLGLSWPFPKSLDGISVACRLLYAQENCREVTFPKLMNDPVLFPKSTAFSVPGVPKNEAGFVENCDFISFLQFTPFISPNERLVDECAIA